MSYKIAIASGKGGTGKTTVAVSIYSQLANLQRDKVSLIDCDVEEPNDVIFFSESEVISKSEVFQKIPEIDIKKCTFCRKCSEYCEFNAVVVLPTAKFAEVNSSLCHSCGACIVACEHSAIKEYNNSIGEIAHYVTQSGRDLKEGKLKVGSAMQTLLIRELKKTVCTQKGIIIYDSPPGTSCSVVETVIDCNYVVLVTEPTPLGLHDLKLTVELMQELEKDFGIVVNKSGLGNEEVYQFIKEKNIELLGEIPFSSFFALNYAQGNLITSIPSEIIKAQHKIVEKINKKITTYEGNHHS